MCAAAFCALPLGLARVVDLGACDGADVDALGVGAVGLEAARALLLVRTRRARRLQPVARVGTHVDALPDDVVDRLAMGADAEGVVHGLARRGAEVEL